jgi:hypothetical protein
VLEGDHAVSGEPGGVKNLETFQVAVQTRLGARPLAFLNSIGLLHSIRGLAFFALRSLIETLPKSFTTRSTYAGRQVSLAKGPSRTFFGICYLRPCYIALPIGQEAAKHSNQESAKDGI